MIFSNNSAKSVIGFFVGAGLLVSCSENKSLKATADGKATFIIEKVEAPADFIAVGEPNNQGKYSQKLLPLQACIKDHAESNSVSRIRFDIVAGDATIEKVTDHRGCLQWQELIEFDPDDEAKNIMMSRTIVARESHAGSTKVVFTVNPIAGTFKDLTLNGTYVENQAIANPVSFKVQQFAAGSNQGTETKDNKVIYVKIENRLGGRTSRMSRQTEIETLNLESKGVDFYNLKMDQNLNLIFPFKYYTRFSISLIRQQIEGIAGEAIKRGNFRFYLVALKENVDLKAPAASDILAAVEFDATPRGDAGLITVPVTLNLSNVTAITNRVNFLFTVVSTDSPARFEDQTFEGFHNGLSAGSDLAIKLYPSDASAALAYQEHVKHELQAKKAAKISMSASLAAAGAVQVTNPLVKYTVKEALAAAPVTKVIDLKTVVEKLEERKSLNLDEKRAVCSAYYQAKISSIDDLNYQNCLNSPAQHLEASVTEFVESVDPDVTSDPMVLDVEKFNMTSEFKVGKTVEHGNGNSWDSSVDGKVGLGYSVGNDKVGDPPKPGSIIAKIIAKLISYTTGISPVLEMNASIGGKAYVSRDAKVSQVDANNASITVDRTLTSIPLVITMNAKTTKCMVILKKAPAANAFSRYFCTATKDESRTEYYYLVDYTRVDKTNVVMDVNSGVTNPFHLLVRGTETYKSLRETLTSKGKITTFYISRIDEKKLEDPSHFMTQEAPMVLSAQKNLMSR